MEETAQLVPVHFISHPHHITVPIYYHLLPGNTSSFCYFPDGGKGVRENDSNYLPYKNVI